MVRLQQLIGSIGLLVEAACAVAVHTERQCGVPAIAPELVDLNIVGGRQAVPGSWPWHVALYAKPPDGSATRLEQGHLCGGALIDDRTVITAAHCVVLFFATPGKLRVHLGVHRRLARDADELFVDVEHICIYPQYRRGNDDDIAIIRLVASVPFSDTVSPVCLPDEDDEVRVDSDELLYITGWGFTAAGWDQQHAEVLMQARVAYLPKDDCLAMRAQNLNRTICASHDLGSSCHDDSGGPLVLARDGVWQLQGVVSGGPPLCGLKHWPMYYSEVPKFVSWIAKYRASNTPQRDAKLCR